MFCALPQTDAYKAFDKINSFAPLRNTPIVLVKISYYGTVNKLCV